MRLAVFVLITAMLTASCSVSRPADDATGEEIYGDLCSNCHAADLSGGVGPSLGAGSNSAREDDEYLEFTIMNGRGRMPSFSSSLDEAQLERLVDYMRQVQGQ